MGEQQKHLHVSKVYSENGSSTVIQRIKDGLHSLSNLALLGGRHLRMKRKCHELSYVERLEAIILDHKQLKSFP